MSYSTFPNEAFDEWNATVRCDGRTTLLKVRRRFGEQHTNDTSFAMEAFQIFQDDEEMCLLILPTGLHREGAKRTAVQALPKFLGCCEIEGEQGGDPADAIFGVTEK